MGEMRKMGQRIKAMGEDGSTNADTVFSHLVLYHAAPLHPISCLTVKAKQIKSLRRMDYLDFW